MKPYKGEIYDPQIHYYDRDLVDESAPDLKDQHLYFVVLGRPVGHPRFTDCIRTSMVVKYDETTGMIETLNSQYKLIGKVKKIAPQ